MEKTSKEVDQEPKENLETEVLEQQDEDSMRESVVNDYGLDPEVEIDLIDKLVKDKQEEQKKLRTAISQKRNWRDKAEKALANKPSEIEESDSTEDESETSQVIESTKSSDEKFKTLLKEELDNRDLISMSLSDELKAEVKDYANVKGISVAEAVESDYIKFLKDQKASEDKIEDATISSSNRRPSMGTVDFSKMSAGDFDSSTEEGRKQFDEYKDWLKTQD
jgi:hypothetical protein